MRNRIGQWGLIALLAFSSAWGSRAAAEPPAGRGPRVARGKSATLDGHPLDLIIRDAEARVEVLKGIDDYSCTFVKRERIDGEMRDYQYMDVKVRHEPFSVYMKFVKPDELNGQEVLYVAGQNNGKLWAHGVGLKAILGTMSLDPKGNLAMNGNRHPITEFGLNFLNQRIRDRAKQERRTDTLTEVRSRLKGKVDGRPCIVTEIIHPQPQPPCKFNLVRIYIDNQHGLPIRYETFDWPEQAGGQPVPLEEYTFQNLRFNNGFQDIDFDIKNPAYGF